MIFNVDLWNGFNKTVNIYDTRYKARLTNVIEVVFKNHGTR